MRVWHLCILGLLVLLVPGISRAQSEVRINEFMASNSKTKADEDGDFSDWIELFNAGTKAVNLQGFGLSDDPGQPFKWRLPSTNIAAQGYLVIFASGKNRTTRELHSNFSLDSGGEYLSLTQPDGTVVSEFNPYPAQSVDVSYGLLSGVLRFFSTPTPGAANRSGSAGLAAEPVFDPPGGIFTNAVTLRIRAPGTGNVIRYTTDGREPTATSPVFPTSLVVTNPVKIRARTFRSGSLPSEVLSQNYIFVDSQVAAFTSNLPLVFVHTYGTNIVDTGDHPTAVVFIDTFRGRSSTLGTNDFIGNGGIRIRGQSSEGFPKKAYALEIQDELGRDRKAPLLGMPEESDWILYNPYTDKSLMRNVLAYHLTRELGYYASHTKFVEMFLSTDKGKITMANYVGVYVFMEKLKQSPHRVDIRKLYSTQNTEPDISGGYLFKRDKLDSGESPSFTTYTGLQLIQVDPEWAELSPQQRNWFTNYIYQFELTLNPNGTTDGPNGYSKYIDVKSFIDYGWMVELPRNCDMLTFSTYMHKDRGKKLEMGPVWDFDIGFGNIDYNNCFLVAGWHASRKGALIQMPWFTDLHTDPEYEQKSIDRWQELRRSVFATDRIHAFIDSQVALLNESKTRNFQRWPVLGQHVWPNPCPFPVIWPYVPGGTFGVDASGVATPCPVQFQTYEEEVAYLKKWTKDRVDWIDTAYPATPIFSQAGGSIQPGFSLSITNPSPGIVFYTLDGTDPRAVGGLMAGNATAYAGPIVLNTNARVFARTWFTNCWSGPQVATFHTSVPAVRITEVMYHPLPGSKGDSSFYEFVELKNIGTAAIDLKGFRLRGGIELDVTNSLSLPPGGYAVAVANLAAFQERYGNLVRIAGVYSGSLGNSGEKLVLEGPLQVPIHSFTFRTGNARMTDGNGFSLVVADELAALDQWSSPGQWRASARVGGSPGQADPAAESIAPVLISEVFPASAVGAEDAIELHNPGAGAQNVGGWYLSDHFDQPKKYRIPAGTSIPAGGYLVLHESQFNSGSSAFSLNSSGDSVYLFSANDLGGLTGFYHGFKFGAADAGSALGPVTLSTGGREVARLRFSSLGSSNPGPLSGPLVINEIHFRPPDVVTNSEAFDNTEEEFVELFNVDTNAVPLSAAGNQQWYLDGGVEYQFPTNTSIPAGGFVVVVGFNPTQYPQYATAFRNKFGIPAGVAVLGPYSGKLDHSSDSLRLLRENLAAAPGRKVLIDRVEYSDAVPWPTGADGTGKSIQKTNPTELGNDPVNWIADAPTPGRPYAGLGSILISAQPQDQTVAPGAGVSFSVTASGEGMLKYQWRHDGSDLAGETNAMLSIPRVGMPEQGGYSVLVRNAKASLSSREARLAVNGDSDGDGLPDDWEDANGFDKNDPATGSADFDKDGMSNLSEYLAGTDPKDPSSALRLELLSVTASSVALKFSAVAGKSYSVWYKDQLQGDAWTRLKDVPPPAASGPVNVSDDTAWPSRRFYRVTVR